MRKLNLTDHVFGRLTVTKQSAARNGKTMWSCACECGNTHIAGTATLRAGHTQSCGCLFKEVVGNNRRTHGMSETSEFKIWQDIVKRCTKEYKHAFKDYGGRGITVCDTWLESFESFYYDMGDRPTPEYTIERHDNEQGYNPCNCYWATRLAQANNTRQNVFIEHDGKRMTIAQWARHIGIPYMTLYSRLYRYSWSIERALS